ncbi:MAG: uroporphyrinogen-III synthase [Verrucomicrobia bacterium]|nr:uroporphyrinogen-III synthase [Verrucomicrobiota bacterium]
MILYLGIDPSRWPEKVFHYPVIRTEPLEVSKPTDWHEATHILFTSRSAVRHWKYFDSTKQIIALGTATALLLEKPLVAPIPTQEGVVDLLRTLSPGYLIWPRSTLSRDHIADYLRLSGIRHTIIPLYQTIFQQPGPPPNLALFTEIVFTSPSTIDAFLAIYGALPRNIRLTPIGPVTAEALKRKMEEV